ncbi:hypothetical protein [Mucilaginibacter sp. FT3.2]|uniref:hypothetical protein n=1 Tax=Mucilaginibacter sp. FT3.2 TaxID=2723090 RepID=UPI001612494A|nr:hypothetical protein [Mucilaginibacter sp. FT3.2]MBB6235288.1 Tfp pilus assembly protein PilN [Mucilaginibacter sp. FT3.2]
MLAQYYGIGEATGITVDLRKDGSYELSCCGVATDHKQLTIEKKVVGLEAIANLPERLNTKNPVALNLSGKEVLFRQISVSAQDQQEDISKLIPGINPEDFYVQRFTSGEVLFLALIRKAVADHWINILREQGFTVLMLSLGPFPVAQVLNQLNVYEGEVLFNGNKISRDEKDNWTGVTFDSAFTAPFTLKLGSEVIDQKLLVSYAAAFQLVLAAKLELVSAAVDLLDTRFSEVTATRKLKVNAALALGVFFILLLVNFVVLSWLNAENLKLNDKVSLTASSTSDMQALTDRIKEKEDLLADLGWDGGANKARLIDQVAALMPGEITMKDIAVNPVDERNNRSGQELKFLGRRIRMAGSSEQVIAVNEWIARIKTLKWVKNAQLENYNYSTELNTGKFTIIVNY